MRIYASITLDMGAGLSAYGRGTANILACPLETVVAEKMHAVIDHTGQNSRSCHIPARKTLALLEQSESLITIRLNIGSMAIFIKAGVRVLAESCSQCLT